MATIWWCKTAKQYAVDLWRKGAKKRFYLGKNRRAAEKRRADVLQELQAQEAEPVNPALSLEDLSESFLQYAHDNKAESTYEFYRHLLSAFVRAHRGWAALDVTPIELEAFKRKLLAEGLSPTTVSPQLPASEDPSDERGACHLGETAASR